MAAALTGPVTTACPASALRTISQATVYLEPDSARLLPDLRRRRRPGSGPSVPGHVVEMMDRVVEQVAAEPRDAEAGAVAAPSGPEPLLAPHSCRSRQPARPRHRPTAPRRPPGPARRSAASTAVTSWSQFGIERIVLAQHEKEPLVVERADVAHVAGVLQRRPAVVGRASAHARRRSVAARAARRPRCRAAAGATDSAARRPASNPHSGQGRSRTQVQSLSSGTTGTLSAPLLVQARAPIGPAPPDCASVDVSLPWQPALRTAHRRAHGNHIEPVGQRSGNGRSVGCGHGDQGCRAGAAGTGGGARDDCCSHGRSGVDPSRTQAAPEPSRPPQAHPHRNRVRARCPHSPRRVVRRLQPLPHRPRRAPRRRVAPRCWPRARTTS